MHICWFLYWIHKSLPRVFTIKCGVVIEIWSKRSRISFRRIVSLWCLLSDPHLTNYTPIKYRHPFQKSNWISPAYLKLGSGWVCFPFVSWGKQNTFISLSKAYRATGTPIHERSGEYPLLVEEWRLIYPWIRAGESLLEILVVFGSYRWFNLLFMVEELDNYGKMDMVIPTRVYVQVASSSLSFLCDIHLP